MAQVQGKIVQCIGAVVDVEFPRNAMPKVFDALKLDGSALTLEVQQLLGDGVVRTIALGSSDGLRRGLMVSNTGNPDRKSTRLNSSHLVISYAVFCLKKKKNKCIIATDVVVMLALRVCFLHALLSDKSL